MAASERERVQRIVENEAFINMVARMVRAAGRRTADDDPDALAQLIGLREYLDRAILVAVSGLRDSGATWQEIGEATGTTRQAAIMKWSKKLA